MVLFVVLVVAGLLVITVHAQLELARLDDELTGALQTVAGVLHTEIDERMELKQAAGDMFEELNLPGLAVAVLDEGGEPLAATNTGLDGAQLRDVGSGPAFIESRGQRWRARSSVAQYRGFTFRLVVWASMQPLDREDTTLREAVLLGVPIALVLAAIGGWVITTRALRPLADMARQADAIDQGLKRARLTVPNAADELGSVAKAFNALLDRVAGALGEQRAFMADASHQLRTPVSVVRTAAQVTLSRPDRTDDEYRESLDIVSHQAQRLTRMVDDMFMLAMVDADGRPLQRAALYINEIVESVAREAALLGIERGITITCATPEDVPFTGDEHLVRQMIWNLVDNALRYAPAESTITLAVERHPRLVHITVSDEGPGVAAADRDRIFHRFVRLESSGGTAGAGLGLPIARWIAEAHGGQLAIDDQQHGCRFRITLPAAD